MERARNGRFVTRLWRVVGILLVLLSLLVGQSILTSRHQHEEQAAVECYSVARVLAGDVAGLVDKVRLALHTVALERERQLATQARDDGPVRNYVAGIHLNLPEVAAIRIADETGRVRIQEAFTAAPMPGIEATEYFARMRDAHDSGIAISAPHRDGPGAVPMIDIARRIEYPDGRFAGVAFAHVPVRRFVEMLGAADVGPNGAVSLRGDGLAMIARHPPMEAARARAPDALRDLVARGEISGTFHAISPLDGVERLFSYRKVGGYPLHVTVGRSTEEYLGHWRRDMGVVVVLSSVLFGVSVAGTLMVDRAWRRQRSMTRVLEMQAHTDPLTGLANRRHFFESAEAELARSRRYAAPLSILMLDIDHFKDVNDAHGHRAGDRVLKELARTCGQVLRAVDITGRVGGEEFAILLPETALAGAIEVAERLREAVEGTRIARDEGVPLRVTVSIGVATLAGEANLDTLMSQADDALYDAKHGGRNLVRAFRRPA